MDRKIPAVLKGKETWKNVQQTIQTWTMEETDEAEIPWWRFWKIKMFCILLKIYLVVYSDNGDVTVKCLH